MNRREERVAERLKASAPEGVECVVLHNGWPDFLVLHVRDGEIVDGFVAEHKPTGAKLTFEQQQVRKFLEARGIRYAVETEDGNP